MTRQLLIGAGMIAATALIVLAGSARSQEVGTPVDMTGFLCDSDADVRTMLDRMEPDLDWDQAKERAKGTSCAYDQKAGIIKSSDATYTNTHGDTFAIIAVTAEDKVLYTWRLLKTGTPT